MAKDEGRYILQYVGQDGWYTGHHGVDLNDPAAYIAALNKRPGTIARAIDKDTGEIFGDQTKCGLCGEPHDGVEGSCLL